MTLGIRRAVVMTSLAFVAVGCGSNPPLRTYMLGDPPPTTTGVWSDAGLPVIELRTVSVPDYLDSSDILRSTGPNELTPSPTGRWGERLSLAITHALASALSRRLPRTVIETDVATAPTPRLLVDVERFVIGTDGRCLMAARWQITGGAAEAAATEEHGNFSASARSIDDPAIAAAMTRVVDQLADQIAETARRDHQAEAPRHPGRT